MERYGKAGKQQGERDRFSYPSPHLKSGRLKALGITSAKPSALFPDLPSIAATGLPGYESVSRFAIFAPARTPAAVINLLNREIVKAVQNADVKQKFNNVGIETVGSSPEQLAATIRSEMATPGKVVKNAGTWADAAN